MISIDFEGPLKEWHTTGIFFRPPSDNCKYYLIRFSAVEIGVSCVVDIFETGIPQRDATEFLIENGSEVAAYEASRQYRIALYGKYFFPEFVQQYQWYYNKDGQNEVMAMAEVMEYAIQKGLEHALIIPY